MRVTTFLSFALAGAFLLSAPLAAQKEGDPAKGKEVFEQCAVCHEIDSDEKKMGPSLKGLFAKETLSDGKTKVTRESVLKKINEGGNGMPPYGEMLEKAEINDLMAFLEKHTKAQK
jgi:cytochrome c2